jgi:site-specific DNA-methyltransferase (adenine-specific)
MGDKHWEVICGDTLLVLPQLERESVDGLITDPPYCSGGHGPAVKRDPADKYVQDGARQRYESFLGDLRDQRSYQLWVSYWIATTLPALKSGAPFAIFCDWRQLAATIDAIQVGGLVVRGVAVWDKTEACRPQRGRPRQQAEFIIWGCHGSRWVSYEGAPTLPGVLRFATLQHDRNHIAEKPAALMRQLALLVVPGGLVLDPFAGSGTILEAALSMGRRALGVELHPHWAEHARQRCLAMHADQARLGQQGSLF